MVLIEDGRSGTVRVVLNTRNVLFFTVKLRRNVVPQDILEVDSERSNPFYILLLRIIRIDKDYVSGIASGEDSVARGLFGMNEEKGRRDGFQGVIVLVRGEESLFCGDSELTREMFRIIR